jgi:hypothetical protein
VCWIDGDVQLASIDACLLGDKVWLAAQARKWCPAVTGQNDFPLNSFRSQTKKKEIIFFSFPPREGTWMCVRHGQEGFAGVPGTATRGLLSLLRSPLSQ